MPVGLYSPWPPSRSGVADYSAALLPYLQRYGEIEANPATCDLGLYHLGNHPGHRPIYTRSLQQPGVTVIHDAVLNHFFLSLDESGYVAEFLHNYGPDSADLARRLYRESGRSESDPPYFAYSMLKRPAEAARAVIVHNPAAYARVREHAPEARVIEIPHLFVPPPVADSSGLREQLGISPDTLVIGAFGHQRPTKRLNSLLRALHQALAQGADIVLLLTGQFASPKYEQSIAPLLQHPRIRRTGYLSAQEFWRYAQMCDACLNLRYPSAGEASGIGISFMGIGKAVLFTDGPELARYPENACLRVPAGAEEEPLLCEYLVWLAQNRDAAQEIGKRAAAHIAREHDPDKVARAYWDVLKTA